MIPPTSIDGTDITGATIDGTEVQEITVDGQTVFSAVQGYDLRGGFTELARFTQNDNAPTGTSWNDDGSKVFSAGTGNEAIFEYALSNNYDITTASLTRSVSGSGDNKRDVEFNDDGTKMYDVAGTEERVFQFNCSNFDLSTLSSDGSLNLQSDFPCGIAFGDGGSIMYEVGPPEDRIWQYSLSTPYDVNTASLVTSILIRNDAPISNFATGVQTDINGQFIYVADQRSDAILQYEFGTPWQVNTITNLFTFDTSPNQPKDISWKPDGTLFLTLSAGTDELVTYSL